MNHKSLKIAIFCFLWGFTGTMVALQVHPYFWWAGMLAGVGGYITWELGNVIRAVPRAWRKATSWRPDMEWWRDSLSYFGYSFFACMSLSAFFFLPLIIISLALGKNEYGLGLGISWCIVLSLLMTAMVLLFLSVSQEEGSRQCELNMARNLAKKCNFFTICARHIPKGIYWLIIRTPAAANVVKEIIWNMVRVIGRFLYHLLRMIHSEERLMAGVYISSGVAVGYLAFGNAIAGGLAAAVLAYASREIISKRVLKVIPMRNGR